MLNYDVVDVFAERPFAGNQLAVIHGAEELSDEQMLQLAKEFGYSEITFPSSVSGNEYTVRIFTPGGELPFAGHPTLGTAWVLHELGHVTEPSLMQHCAAGDIAVSVGDGLVRLAATPSTVEEVPHSDAVDALAGLGLGEGDLDGTAYVAGTGLPWLLVRVTDEAVGRASAGVGARDCAIYSIAESSAEDDAIVSAHLRAFVPGSGIAEDPATGSAAAGLGIVLAASGVLPEGGEYVISQGAEIGRPSVLHGRVTAAAGVASLVEVAGAVQKIASGAIAVPPVS